MVSDPPLAAVSRNVAVPVELVTTEAALSVLLRADATVTVWLATALLPESTRVTVYVPCWFSVRPTGPCTDSEVPATFHIDRPRLVRGNRGHDDGAPGGITGRVQRRRGEAIDVGGSLIDEQAARGGREHHRHILDEVVVGIPARRR